MGHWDDFEIQRLDMRKASLAGDKTLPSFIGYQIDSFRVGDEPVTVTEFPFIYGGHLALDSFLLRGEKVSCTGFFAHIDLESNSPQPSDNSSGQPRQLAGTEKGFSLVIYSTAVSRYLIKTYPEGEPGYQTVRSDVQNLLTQPFADIFGVKQACNASIPGKSYCLPTLPAPHDNNAPW